MYEDGKFCTDPDRIRAELLGSAHSGVARHEFSKVFNLANTVLYPEKTDMRYFSESDGVPKSFFSSDGFVSTDRGNHIGRISNGYTSRPVPKLALLHFSVRGVPHYKAKAAKASEIKRGHICQHWSNDVNALSKQGAEAAFTSRYLKPPEGHIMFNFFGCIGNNKLIPYNASVLISPKQTNEKPHRERVRARVHGRIRRVRRVIKAKVKVKVKATARAVSKKARTRVKAQRHKN